MSVIGELRSWLAPEIKELKARLEALEEKTSQFGKELKEIEALKERIATLEAMSSNTFKELKEVKQNQLRNEEKLSEIFKMMLEIIRMITKLEDKIDLEKRIERLEEAVLKKK